MVTDDRPSLHVGDAIIELVKGDITQIPADVIVNAASSELRGGGGVDGAIHRRGGPGLMQKLRERYPSGTPTGTAVATAAGDLPARWVVHAVGPRWTGGRHGEEGQLRAAYESAMRVANDLGAVSITFPANSCGIYGYPLDDGARVGVGAVRDGLAAGSTLRHATFALFSDETFKAFERALHALEVALPAD